MRQWNGILVNSHTFYYLETAEKLSINIEVVDAPNLFKFSKGNSSFYINATKTNLNSGLASSLSQNKWYTHLLLSRADIPTTNHSLVTSAEEALKFFSQPQKPVVMKPLKNKGGKDVCLKLTSTDEVYTAGVKLQKKYQSFLIEEYLEGNDYRVLVLNSHVIGVVLREPPYVIGDGIQTIDQLSEPISRLVKDDYLTQTLSQQSLNLESIPTKGQKVLLRKNANASTGALTTTIDPNQVHPHITNMVTKACDVLTLRFGGVDLISQDLTSTTQASAQILEINSSPGLLVHYHNVRGKVYDVAADILQACLAHAND